MTKRLTTHDKEKIYLIARRMLRDSQRVYLNNFAHQFTEAERAIAEETMNIPKAKWCNFYVLKAKKEYEASLSTGKGVSN